MTDERAPVAAQALAVPGLASQADGMRPAAQREAMSQFATGVTVITVGGEHSHGMTANAVTSLSLDPPLLLCCVSHTARLHRAIVASRCFGISVLAAGQEELARYFTDQRRPTGPAQFDTVDWLPGPRTGAPLLCGALAWFECALAETHDGGDHSIFVGDVLASSRRTGQPGLVFFGGGFHEIAAGPR